MAVPDKPKFFPEQLKFNAGKVKFDFRTFLKLTGLLKFHTHESELIVASRSILVFLG